MQNLKRDITLEGFSKRIPDLSSRGGNCFFSFVYRLANVASGIFSSTRGTEDTHPKEIQLSEAGFPSVQNSSLRNISEVTIHEEIAVAIAQEGSGEDRALHVTESVTAEESIEDEKNFAAIRTLLQAIPKEYWPKHWNIEELAGKDIELFLKSYLSNLPTSQAISLLISQPIAHTTHSYAICILALIDGIYRLITPFPLSELHKLHNLIYQWHSEATKNKPATSQHHFLGEKDPEKHAKLIAALMKLILRPFAFDTIWEVDLRGKPDNVAADYLLPYFKAFDQLLSIIQSHLENEKYENFQIEIKKQFRCAIIEINCQIFRWSNEREIRLRYREPKKISKEGFDELVLQGFNKLFIFNYNRESEKSLREIYLETHLPYDRLKKILKAMFHLV